MCIRDRQDLYCKMLNQAIEVLKGETPEEDFETKIDLMCDAFVPASYIKNETLKMDIYKSIAGIETDEAVSYTHIGEI